MPAQQARARTRQQQILDAAASVFARRGYRAAAMDEIAREADTSKGGLYFHFLLRTRGEKAMATEHDPVARAEIPLHVLLRTLTRHRKLARILAIEAIGAGGRLSERALAIEDEFAALVQAELDAAIVSGAIEPIDTRVAAQAWIGTLHAVVLRWLTTERASAASLDATYETIRTMLLRSVGAEQVPPLNGRPDRSTA